MAQPLWCLSSNASGFRLLDLRRGWCAFVHSDDDHVRLLDLRRGWCAFVHSDDDHVRLLDLRRGWCAFVNSETSAFGLLAYSSFRSRGRIMPSQDSCYHHLRDVLLGGMHNGRWTIEGDIE
jgi:hypothetical protein